MNDSKPSPLASPKHNAVRSFLRIAGPLTLLAGAGFIGIGLISFFAAFGNFQFPKLFWCVFVGIPLLFVGLVMTKFGYLGAVARYVAAEAAPVAKDTVNYMTEGTQDSIKTVGRALGEGFRESQKDPNPKTPNPN